MIISHKLKIIYIKLRKVAGTSFEVALSRYCGADDILTPMEAKNAKPRYPGYSGARNYQMFDIKKRIAHLGLEEIKPIISAEVFNNYLKIATIRNPYQTAISWYFWRKRGRKLAVIEEDFINFMATELSHRRNIFLKDYDSIHIKGKLVVDFILIYEHLARDTKQLEMKIGCPGLTETFTNLNAKANIRPAQGSSLYEVYSRYPEAKSMIDKIHDENWHNYELIRKYWPVYKSELEDILSGSQNP